MSGGKVTQNGGELAADQYVRIPGLFRRWELEQVVEPGKDFHLEEAGSTSDGTPLFAVYSREPSFGAPAPGPRSEAADHNSQTA